MIFCNMHGRWGESRRSSTNCRAVLRYSGACIEPAPAKPDAELACDRDRRRKFRARPPSPRSMLREWTFGTSCSQLCHPWNYKGSGHSEGGSCCPKHCWQDIARLATRRSVPALLLAKASSSGTLAPVPKNISSGVCPPNAGCGILVLCSLM